MYRPAPPAGDRAANEASEAARRRGLSILPLLLGLLCFTAALTPSLVPRSWLVQGALAGLVTALGYMIGQAVLTVWRALELPLLSGRAARIGHWLAATPVLVLLAIALGRTTAWQDSIRTRVGMEPVESLHTLEMLGVAIGVFLVCFLIGWGLQVLFDQLRRRLFRIMPVRTANVAGLLLAVLLVTIVTRDWIVQGTMEALDNSYERAQELFATAPPAPTDPRIPGSAASLVDWGAMGQPGRNWVTGGPDAAAITAFTGRPALEPIRVYVGRADRDEPEERAALALEELQRLGAFERKILVVASPTGTGWMDPGAIDTVEYLHDGDIATVVVQYSFLQSPLALIFETETGLDQAIATMRAVYGYWRTLPDDTRPEFYMHGISLGAWSSMYSFDIFAMIDDPISGAVWSGPPFPSQLWRRAVAMRNSGTPVVHPEVGEGELFRFASHFEGPDRDGQTWGRLRIVYLQHASDAIVFYEPTSFWRVPEWMKEPRAPDVSPLMRFVPLVTQFQLAVDMAIALAVPPGFGHNYASRDYIEPWVSVTRPANWTAEDTARLKDWCTLPDDELGCRN